MRKKQRVFSLLAALMLVLGFTNGALAVDKTSEQTLAAGSTTFTYTLDFDAISQPYASAQFDITVSDKNGLSVQSIAFDSKYPSNINTLTSGWKENGSRMIHQAGFFSTDNLYTNAGGDKICTVTFGYTGSAAQTVTFDNLQVWRLTGEVKDGLPQLVQETLDWSRVIRVSRSGASGSGTSGGGTSGGGTGSTSGSTASLGTTTVNKTTTVGTTVMGTVDVTTRKTTGAIRADAVADLIAKAKDAEGAGQKAVVEITLGATEQFSSTEISIPKSAFRQLSEETGADVKIRTGISDVTFDAAAIRAINAAATAEDIKITVTKADAYALSDTIRAQVGGRPVYDFTVTSGSGTVSSFGGGSARVSLPYTPAADENPNAIVVYYVSTSGALQTVRGRYDQSAGAVTFTTTHFSKYAVGYNEISFGDIVDTDWYHDAVTFLSARGITTGTGSGFAPGATLTRGQFLVLLMRAYGIAADETPADNFADAGHTYYTGYLSAAKRMGITDGVGENRYAPESSISRQDMCTLLYRALGQLGDLPETSGSSKQLGDFSDAAQVADYAADAMSNLVRGGILSGSDGRLTPASTTTRAEMAQVLYKLLSAS